MSTAKRKPVEQPSTRSKPVTTRLAPELLAEVERMAAEDERTVSFVIAKAVAKYVEGKKGG